MKHLPLFLSSFFVLVASTRLMAQEPGRSDTLDILHYDIRLNIIDFTNKSINGVASIKTTFKQADVQVIPFDLLALSVDSIYIGKNKHTDFSHNDTLISIQLPSPAGPGDTLLISIFYHGTPAIDPSSWGGFYYTANSAYNMGIGIEASPHNLGRIWFPCVDEFREKALYDFHITTLDKHMAVCNGTLVSSATNPDNTKTWHWKLNTPIPAYLASVAVSDYKAINIPLAHGIDTTQAFIYVAPSDTLKARNSFVHLNRIFNAFIDYWGAYKWERVGFVAVPFNAGAMEHATNIAYPVVAIDGTLNNENLYAHELAHSWFGNLVTCASSEDMWINEGWARYSEALYRGILYPNSNPLADGYKMQIRDLQYKTFRKSFTDDGGHFALHPMPQNITYGTTTYDKGALMIHTLRYYLGDQAFFRATKQILQEYAYRSINSAELCDRLSYYSNTDLHDFFNAWIYQSGHLHFSVDSLVKNPDPSNKYTYHVRQKHSLGLNLGNSNRVEITFFDQQWNSFTDTIRFSGEFGSKSVILPFEPILTAVDYHEKMSDAIVDYNIKITEPGTISCTHAFIKINTIDAPDSALLRIEHHWVSPDPIKTHTNAIKRLSPNRYWKIDGIVPQNIHATVGFTFMCATDMDAMLLNNTSPDSLVLLYRKNTSEDWQMIPFSKTGTTTGRLTADILRLGEYTLAIGDKSQLETLEKTPETLDFTVTPNPNKGIFTIHSSNREIDSYSIIDTTGKTVQTIDPHGTETQTAKLRPGTYLIYANSLSGKILMQKKMTVIN